MHSKPSSFYGKKLSLYPCSVTEVLIKLIFFRKWCFLNDNNNNDNNNNNDFIFIWIIRTRYMTNDNKIMYLILASLQLGVVQISLRLHCHILILNSLHLIFMVSNGLLQLLPACDDPPVFFLHPFWWAFLLMQLLLFLRLSSNFDCTIKCNKRIV